MIIQIMIVNIVLNRVLISISKIKLNWNASSINNVKWCITTESNKNEVKSTDPKLIAKHHLILRFDIHNLDQKQI